MPIPTILSTRNGTGSVSGYRDDLVAADLVGLSLSNYVGITSVLWELTGRPEGSAAGGAGPEPIALATANTAAFNVDSDSGDFRLDGTYTVQATLNPGSPGQLRITTVLCRLSGLTIPGAGASVRVLRKLGGFEALEDTSVPTILQGWATELNRWLELLRGTVSGGAGGFTTLAGAYSHGASGSDQTMVLHDSLGGGIIIDAAQGNFTGASALRVNTAAGGPVVIDRATGRVGIGIAAPLQAVHAKGTAPALRLDRTGGAALDVMNVGDDLQVLNGATVLGKFKSTGGLQADLGVGIGTAPATGAVLALGAASSVPISAGGSARFRYNEITGHAEWSENGGAYQPFGTSTASAYATVDAAGTPLTQRTILNFIGPLTPVDNSGATRTDVSIATNGITNALFRQGAALSVVGNPTGSTANVQDIAAGADGRFLGRSGGALAWGLVPYSSVSGAPAAGITSLVGDGTATGPGAATFILTNIPDGTTAAGAILFANSVAPATPAIGFGDLYADALSKNLAFKNNSGAVTHAVKTIAAVGGQFLTAIDDDGTVHTGSATTTVFYQTIDTAGTPLTQRPVLNASTGLVAVDNGGASRTDLSIATNGVTNALLRQGAALSVVGNPTASTANLQDIAASSAATFLGYDGTSLAFRTVPGASIRADGIVTGTVQLASIAAASLSDGTQAYVDTVGDSFILGQSTLTVDNKTVVTASGKAGYQWRRLGLTNLAAAARTGWWVDPANVSTTASDENTGASSAVPLSTFAELGRRLKGVTWTQSTITVTLMSNAPSSDALVLVDVRAGANLPTLNIVGVPTVIDSGRTISTPRNPAVTANDHFEITDGTATFGPWIQNYLLHRTNGTSAYFWPYKDLGSGKLQISLPIAPSNINAIQTLTNGDTYEVLRLPTFADVFMTGNSALLLVTLTELAVTGASGVGIPYANAIGTGVLTYDRVLFNGFSSIGSAGGPPISLYNVCMPASAGGSVWQGSMGIVGGLFAGNGTSTVVQFTSGFILGGNNSNVLTLGGAQFQVSHDARFEKLAFMAYDFGSGWQAATVAHFSSASVTTIGGERNASQLLSTDSGGKVSSLDFTQWNPAATSATPYAVTGNLYTQAQLGIDTNKLATQGGGIYQDESGTWGGDLIGTGANPVVGPNAISNAKFRQSAGLSVVGNSTNSTANVGDIISTTTGQVLQNLGTTIGWALLSYQTIDAAGSPLTQRPALNFSALLAATDNSGSNRTDVTLANTAVTPGSYSSANITIDQQGRITLATNGGGVAFYQTFEANGAAVTQRGAVSFSTDFGVVDNSGSARTDVSLANAGAGAATYGTAGVKSITLDAKGRATAITTATYLTSTGASPGTFNNVTITGDGLVTGGSNVAYLTSAFYQTVAEAGTALTQRGTLNFDGTVVATDSASPARTNVGLPNVGPGAGLQGGAGVSGIVLDAQGRVASVNIDSYLNRIQTAGTPLTQRPALNFDANFSVVDNGGSSRTDVSLGSAGAISTTFGAAGKFIQTISVDASGRVAAAASVSWPSATQVLVSTGSAAPVGDSSFVFDTTVHALTAGNAVVINGSSVGTNLSMVLANFVNTDRDRAIFFVGGGTLGPTGTADSTLFDIRPSDTSINAKLPRPPAIYSTARIRGLNYPGGSIGDAASVIASLYVDAAPTTSVLIGPTYSIYAASGLVHFGSDLEVVGLVSPGSLTVGVGGGAIIGVDSGTGTLRFFGASPQTQQTGGAATAGVVYTATEQGMLNRAYAALRVYGLLS